MKCRWLIVIGIWILIAGRQMVYAEEIRETDAWEQFRESLPDAWTELLSEELDESEMLEKAQDALSLSSFWQEIGAHMQELWPSVRRLLRNLLGVILFSAVFRMLRDTASSSALVPVLDGMGVLALGTALVSEVSGIISHGSAYISGLTKIVNGVTPIAVVLCAGNGQVQQSVVIRTALMLLYTLFQNVNAVLLVPPVRALFGLGIAGSLGGPVHLDAVARRIRQWLGWGVGFFMMILSLMIGMQTVIARSADSLSMRAVQYAIGNFIPVVGGALSGALDTALGSIGTIRSVCGTVCAAAVVLLVMPVLLELMVHRAAIGVCQMVAEMVGCEREGQLLGEIHGMLGYVLALTAVTSLLFLFVLALLAGVGGGGGL